jgi:membrane-associated phospholipid phosphatase
LDYADLRPDRSAEIISQLGFPTAYFSMILGLHAGQHKKTFELLTATQVLAAHAAMAVKHALAVRRPDQLDGRILPMIPTPGHGSFPSAHATEAYAALTVLTELVTTWQSLADSDGRLKVLRGLAERIAVNRTVAGVHYPIDSWAGATLGVSVGRAILKRCGVVTATPSLSFVAGNSDFFDHDFKDPALASNHGLTEGAAFTMSSSQTFEWLWTEAAAEKQRA